MPMLMALLMFLTFLTGYEATSAINAGNRRVAEEANAIGDSMRVYRAYAQRYASAHTTYTGQLPDTELPSWYVRPVNVKDYITGGAAYVFSTQPPQGLVGAIAKRSSDMSRVGVSTNGYLIGPSAGPGSITIPLPSAIPAGSVVITP